MRILALMVAVILMVLVVIMARHTQNPSDLKIESIACFTFNPYDGCVKIEMSSGELQSIRKLFDNQYGTYEYISIKLPSDDLREMKVSSELRDFSPRAEWFTTPPPTDYGLVLAIKWNDGLTSFAVPHESMRKTIPEDAALRYADMDSVILILSNLNDKYRNSTNIKRITSSNSVIAQYERESEKARSLSEPQKRQW